jgi:hypothetical protein
MPLNGVLPFPSDIDYALALDDVARVGALRFRINAEGPFLIRSTPG